MKKNSQFASVIGCLYETYVKYPTRKACCDDKTVITYGELWKNSHIVAKHIHKNFSRQKPVPILMKKSCITLEIIWGIIKAGNCYCIVDPNLPQIRINKILEELKAERAVSDTKYKNKLPQKVDFIDCNEVLTGNYEVVKDEVDKIINQIIDVDPLYVMFTSGSTGTPKGVVVSHRSVMDFIGYFVQIFDITENDVLGNQAPWDFDVSVKDIFSAAWTGACLQIIAKKYFSFPVELVKLLEEKKVTTLTWAVSALCILSSQGLLESQKPNFIKKIIFSGESMPVKHYNVWRKAYPDAMFVNVYGPTEITCNCSYFFVEGLYGENDSIPIGQSFPNERIFLLNENGKLIEPSNIGAIGEVYVSGTAVSQGYYNNDIASKSSYIQNPLNDSYREIVYKTGDLAYYNSEGNLCYAGRKDFQIKHMGHRIELLEIEQEVYALNGISAVCCAYVNNEIYCFVAGNVSDSEVMTHLRRMFPIFMIPKRTVVLKEMPLNKNGKIDRQQLERLADDYR